MQTFLLLQIRDASDPMREQEVGCFARALGCSSQQIRVFDLLSGAPSLQELDAVDVVLLGGSGDYSVAAGGDWLPPALMAMRELVELGKPTFASCWGFQAMAKALGGEVVTDIQRAELGMVEVRLTEAGEQDRVFSPLGQRFIAPMGHQDVVVRLPRQAVLLASSDLVENQAFKLRGKPIYCTQFHPELNREALLERLQAYPQYVRTITGQSLDDFASKCPAVDGIEQLMRRFLQEACPDYPTVWTASQ
jgi:GMP synthase (glutamine-hydrolysing)